MIHIFQNKLPIRKLENHLIDFQLLFAFRKNVKNSDHGDKSVLNVYISSEFLIE